MQVRTITYCDVLSLSKVALGDAMRDYPKEGSKISEAAQSRMSEYTGKTDRKPPPLPPPPPSAAPAASAAGTPAVKVQKGPSVDDVDVPDLPDS